MSQRNFLSAALLVFMSATSLSWMDSAIAAKPAPAGAAKPAASAKAGVSEATKTKLAACFSCHGQDGKTIVDPSYPKLAGQYRDYLERALLDYKSGARKNAIMNGQASQLTKQEIRYMAAYFAALPSALDHGK